MARVLKVKCPPEGQVLFERQCSDLIRCTSGWYVMTWDREWCYGPFETATEASKWQQTQQAPLE